MSISGMMPEYRIVGCSTRDLSDEDFRRLAREACDRYTSGKISLGQWATFESFIAAILASPRPGLPGAIEDIARAWFAEREISAGAIVPQPQ